MHTDLGPLEIDHLQRLVASWGLLADLCFADLLLFAAADDGELVVLGQVRPVTNQTLYRSDLVGTVVATGDRPLVARSLELGEIMDGEVTNQTLKERVRALCIPVRWHGETIAVVNREAAPSVRHPGELERTYIEVFNRFARMIASGEFPFDSEEGPSEEAPRVGDGVIVLDGSGRVEYSSPNAISALHRVGVHANTEGMRLGELGLQETAVRTAFATAVPDTEEIERGPQVTVLMRCIPLIDSSHVTGAVVLLRDISELRRRDRLLLSKDATIREIHHRVKNNLQTVAALLRMQSRRVPKGPARAALDEAVRRVGTIALVHENLSRGLDETVDFDQIVARGLADMVAVATREVPVRAERSGSFGRLRSEDATALAMVVTELVHNAITHGLARTGGVVMVDALRSRDEHDELLTVTVTDDGSGLPEGFDPAASSLGTQIVTSLVQDLRGRITWGSAKPHGTTVRFIARLRSIKSVDSVKGGA